MDEEKSLPKPDKTIVNHTKHLSIAEKNIVQAEMERVLPRRCLPDQCYVNFNFSLLRKK